MAGFYFPFKRDFCFDFTSSENHFKFWNQFSKCTSHQFVIWYYFRVRIQFYEAASSQSDLLLRPQLYRAHEKFSMIQMKTLEKRKKTLLICPRKKFIRNTLNLLKALSTIRNHLSTNALKAKLMFGVLVDAVTTRYSKKFLKFYLFNLFTHSLFVMALTKTNTWKSHFGRFVGIVLKQKIIGSAIVNRQSTHLSVMGPTKLKAFKRGIQSFEMFIRQ